MEELIRLFQFKKANAYCTGIGYPFGRKPMIENKSLVDSIIEEVYYGPNINGDGGM